MKPRRHNTDDGIEFIVQLELLAQYVRGTIVLPVPVAESENCNVFPTRLIVVRPEVATDHGSDAEERKEVGCGPQTEQAFRRASFTGRIQGCAFHCRHFLKGSVLAAPIDKVG